MAEENNTELQETATFWGSLVDVGLNEYQVEWQRISSMQQSAGILVAALAIIYSAMFLFFSLSFENNFLITNQFIANIIFPTFSLDIFFTIITTFYLFHVIWPKKVIGMPSPLNIDKQISEGDLMQKIFELLTVLDKPINEIHKHVEGKQRYYSKGLIACVTSFILTAFLIVFLFIDKAFPNIIVKIYYGFLIIFGFLMLYLIFFKKGEKRDD